MTAEEVKAKLYGRHPGYGGQMPGPWTCIEELHGIDLVAFAAWSQPQPRVSGVKGQRIGYEVKVSRSDLRRELLRPQKRAAAVAWCHQFYFAVPRGLLTADELAYEEPEWPDEAFTRTPCPLLAHHAWRRRRRKPRCEEIVPVPVVLGRYHTFGDRTWGTGDGWTRIPCRTCGGKGHIGRSQVEQEAPTCWVPRDVGLIEVDGRGCTVVKPAPIRREVPLVGHRDLGQMVRWVSMRPDPRHHAQAAASEEAA